MRRAYYDGAETHVNRGFQQGVAVGAGAVTSSYVSGNIDVVVVGPGASGFAAALVLVISAPNEIMSVLKPVSRVS